MPDIVYDLYEKINGIEKKVDSRRFGLKELEKVILNEAEKTVKELLKKNPDAEYYMKDADKNVVRNYDYLKKPREKS